MQYSRSTCFPDFQDQKKVEVGKSAVEGAFVVKGIGTLNLFPNVSDSIKIRLKRTVSVNNREWEKKKKPFSAGYKAPHRLAFGRSSTSLLAFP